MSTSIGTSSDKLREPERVLSSSDIRSATTADTLESGESVSLENNIEHVYTEPVHVRNNMESRQLAIDNSAFSS